MEKNTEIDEKVARKYRALLNHYGCENIVRDFSDKAIYDMMIAINWMGGSSYNYYYKEYKEAEKDEKELKELQERYIKITRKLLKDSGFDEQQIEEKLSQGYANIITDFYCWVGGLQCIFRDAFGSQEVLDSYYKELEESQKKLRKVSLNEVKEIAQEQTITGKNEVIKNVDSSQEEKEKEGDRKSVV